MRKAHHRWIDWVIIEVFLNRARHPLATHGRLKACIKRLHRYRVRSEPAESDSELSTNHASDSTEQYRRGRLIDQEDRPRVPDDSQTGPRLSRPLVLRGGSDSEDPANLLLSQQEQPRRSFATQATAFLRRSSSAIVARARSLTELETWRNAYRRLSDPATYRRILRRLGDFLLLRRDSVIDGDDGDPIDSRAYGTFDGSASPRLHGAQNQHFTQDFGFGEDEQIHPRRSHRQESNVPPDVVPNTRVTPPIPMPPGPPNPRRGTIPRFLVPGTPPNTVDPSHVPSSDDLPSLSGVNEPVDPPSQRLESLGQLGVPPPPSSSPRPAEPLAGPSYLPPLPELRPTDVRAVREHREGLTRKDSRDRLIAVNSDTLTGTASGHDNVGRFMRKRREGEATTPSPVVGGCETRTPAPPAGAPTDDSIRQGEVPGNWLEMERRRTRERREAEAEARLRAAAATATNQENLQSPHSATSSWLTDDEVDSNEIAVRSSSSDDVWFPFAAAAAAAARDAEVAPRSAPAALQPGREPSPISDDEVAVTSASEDSEDSVEGMSLEDARGL
ncbi:hypothetical protein CKM354_000508900 [Cercospora kikuchii]|uniref:Uncharacterized protein n=1 Tax=Cercospora kikuchii TaxID=84275 RepID=A0A9P3CJU9_9PEZI|nr:uncharacterized protein CKM354_000508900 [Cercospora kikuchii]GIZ41795.1 hypothetical protein CKM354_000508900 [Cercospora kikuchii]